MEKSWRKGRQFIKGTYFDSILNIRTNNKTYIYTHHTSHIHTECNEWKEPFPFYIFFPFFFSHQYRGGEGREYIYVQTIRAFAPMKGLCILCGPPTIKKKKKNL